MGYFRRGGSVVDDDWANAIYDSPLVRDAQAALAAAHERAHHDPAGAFVWVGLFEPTVAELGVVRDVLGLEWHQVEDAGNAHQRAKADIDDERGFLVLKTLVYRGETRQVETGQVSIFVGPTYVVTVRHGSPRDLRVLRERVAADPGALATGPLGVLHLIADLVVDGYIAVADQVQQEVEHLEELVFAPHRQEISASIYLLKRENLEIRRAVAPLLPLATDLAHELLTVLPEHMRDSFRDVGEHLLRVADQSESVDSLLLALMAAANAQAQLNQSNDQRKMAAWAALALVPTMVGAIYGMNFQNMPELTWRWGYPAVLALTAGVMVALYRRFRSAGWL
jgi:magnesium transporter